MVVLKMSQLNLTRRSANDLPNESTLWRGSTRCLACSAEYIGAWVTPLEAYFSFSCVSLSGLTLRLSASAIVDARVLFKGNPLTIDSFRNQSDLGVMQR
jgi:hypothetical protein